MFVGGTGATADTDVFPRALNNILGTRMRLVTGYPGGNDITLAMERGEVEARCGWSWSSIKTNHARWVENGTLKSSCSSRSKGTPTCRTCRSSWTW